jgi:hypothetical protein
MNKKKKNQDAEDKQLQENKNWQGVDKPPEEEKDKGEKVSINDLKGKKVDGDPELESDKPLSQDK